MAMPWSRAKQVARALRGQDEFPENYKGSRTIADLTALFQRIAPAACYFFSTRGAINYAAVRYQPGDTLVFGCETRGLPEELLDQHPGRVLGIPMRSDRVRSLNLANAVAIVLYEALRQIQTPDVGRQTADGG